jgi:hypothetical protein
MMLAKLLRLREPRARWVCFEAVLILCVCLPFLQTRTPSTAGGSAVRTAWVAENLQPFSVTESAPVARAGFRFNLRLAILWVLVTGVLMRAGWLLMGFGALHRLRRAARPCPTLPKAVDGAIEGLGTQVLISDRVGGALTFGVRSSVILLPARFKTMSEETQAAVLLHELVHVRERHWLFTVMEECVLTLVWFHPAVWWLVRETQLAREEAVDLEVVGVLRSRDQYVEALMEVAEISGRIRMTPATSFLWRGQLARRVATLFATGNVSRLRRAVSVAVVAIGTLLVLRAALLYFPARSVVHAQSSAAEPIVIESGGDHLLRRGGIEYPRWVQDERVEGLVNAEVSTDGMGRVLDARVLDGPKELRRPVLRSVLEWQYDPQAKAAGTYQVAIRFTLPDPGQSSVLRLNGYPEEARPSGDQEKAMLSISQAALDTIKKMVANVELAEKGQLTGRITRIQTHGAAERMDLHLPVAVGDEVTPEAVLRVQQSVRAIDRELILGLEPGPDGAITMHIFSNADRGQNEERR